MEAENRMLPDSVKKCLTSSVKTPFFLFIGDDQYKSAIDELLLLGFDFVRTSTFCSSDDKLPDIDRLIADIRDADAIAKNKRLVVTGLGEYLALRGNDESSSILSRLKCLDTGNTKVVLLLRGLVSQIDGLRADPRFDSRRFSIVDKADCGLSFTIDESSIGSSVAPGFKAMLAELESGRCGSITMSTVINLDNALFTVHKINNAYEGVKYSTIGFSLPRSCGSDAHWAELRAELNMSGGSLEKVFENHGLYGNLEMDFYARATGNDYRNWIYFLCLKYNAETLTNSYLRFTLEQTNKYENFLYNIIYLISDVSHKDKRYTSFYQERKTLVEKFPESDIANFVVKNRKVVSESIYRLTDGTLVEREEVIVWLSRNGLVPEIDVIYPALAAYLKKYVFKCPELAELLTDYFEAYKRQKLSNSLEPAFLDQVDELARSRKFNRLPTRNEILDRIEKSETYLYWLDALGVEFLAFIEDLARKRGLSIRVHIARAELPTITAINREFFDAWQGRKEKSDELDDVKHKDRGGYNFKNNELPIHLAKELDIVATMINKAATELALRRCQRFLIASDHGASRLAVLRRKEERYETDTKGEHSGRCCELFQPHDLPFAAEENGYLVLADYGRFKGSRAANVEVHGGASLEEVVVPIIELSLSDGSVTVELVDEVVTVDFRSGTEIKLFFNASVQGVGVVLNGKSYPASQMDANHYLVKLPDIKRAGDYSAEVYAGDNLVGKIIIKAQGKSGKVNDAFNDLF